MNEQNPWADPAPTRPAAPITSGIPATPPQESETGLTAEVMARLETGKSLEPRARVTNTATFVLGGLALLVATFSAGAWVGRDHAKSSTAAASTTAGVNPFGAVATGGVSGATGRAGRASGPSGAFPGASGATGAAGGGGAGGFAGAGGTAGTVKLVDGTNVYIATATGTVVKVTTTPQSQISVTKQGTVADLAVGETVVVQGDAGADGTIAATAIRSGAGAVGARGGTAPGAAPGAAPATGATGTAGR